ncbi:MAG: response regulator [Limisphaerales bacterium]
MSITDIKMQRYDGFEFLWVRNHPECCVIPMLVLSSSGEEMDVRRAYELGANAYIRKPGTFEELTRNLRRICDFWEIVRDAEPASRLRERRVAEVNEMHPGCGVSHPG